MDVECFLDVRLELTTFGLVKLTLNRHCISSVSLGSQVRVNNAWKRCSD